MCEGKIAIWQNCLSAEISMQQKRGEILSCKHYLLFSFKIFISHLNTDLRDHGSSRVLMYKVNADFVSET